MKLCVFDSIQQHNLKHLLDLGLCVTVNSDDPSYFGGYLAENLEVIQSALNLSPQDIYKLARNSFEASFLPPAEKQSRLDELDRFMMIL